MSATSVFRGASGAHALFLIACMNYGFAVIAWLFSEISNFYFCDDSYASKRHPKAHDVAAGRRFYKYFSFLETLPPWVGVCAILLYLYYFIYALASGVRSASSLDVASSLIFFMIFSYLSVIANFYGARSLLFLGDKHFWRRAAAKSQSKGTIENRINVIRRLLEKIDIGIDRIKAGWAKCFRAAFIFSIGYLGYKWLCPRPLGEIPFGQLTFNMICENIFAAIFGGSCLIWFFNFPEEERNPPTGKDPYERWFAFSLAAICVGSLIWFWK